MMYIRLFHESDVGLSFAPYRSGSLTLETSTHRLFGKFNLQTFTFLQTRETRNLTSADDVDRQNLTTN